MTYASQNIDNNVATADDYLIKANCLLALNGTRDSDVQALQLINKAKQLDPTNINLYKVEILVELRLKNKKEALVKLNEYSEYLSESQKNLKDVHNSDAWLDYYSFVVQEQDWVKKMILKLNGMIN